MTLRTPRRRISPRTKRRYRAIREFFRRALGSTSQQDIQINSSIAVNVTDLKRKIVGLEQQLDEVSKHCRDIACLDCSRRESESLYQPELKHDIGTIKEQTEVSSDRKSNGIETQLIYKSECDFKKSEESDYFTKGHDDSKEISVKDCKPTMNIYDGHVTKIKSKKNKLHKISNTSTKLHKHKTRSVYDNVATVYSTSSFHSLTNNRATHPDVVYPSHSSGSKQLKDEVYIEEMIPQHHKDKKYKDNLKKNMGDYARGSYDDKPRTRKSKRQPRDLDPDFIADIIRRQYKPIKMFGRKESDVSQFSAPVCRDQEFSLQEDIQEDPELCSCFYTGRHRRAKPRCQDLNGMQSVCDARLYSSKKQLRQKLRRMHIDAYSNSDMYDLVPVKERTSPKTRRKFVESNRFPYDYYREVPPSPRTLRPRLNLKAQYYTELEDYMALNKHHMRKHSPKRQKRYQECMEQFESDLVSEDIPVIPERAVPQQRLPQKYIKIPVEDKQVQEQTQQETGTMSSLQYPQYANEQTSITVDTSLNKTQETEITVDKTDKALCEIKDILQSFLHEIKRDTVASQCDKTDITHDCKTQDNDSNLLQDPNAKLNNNVLPNSASFNNYSNIGQCGITPYIAPFTNPCCYPVMPLCPMNCPVPVPNGYLVPSQSFTCTNCVNAPKETSSAHCCSKNLDTPCHTETDELIKEIYKFVAQSPTRKNNSVGSNDQKPDIKAADSKIMTSRSAGGSCKFYQQDANVGTQPLKCYSKSCEALGSRMISEQYYSNTNASYSDTLLEKLSLEATTQSISETELDTETTDPDKMKRRNKFSKVLRSIGLFKKKKRDVIEELSESESVDIEIKTKKQPPFRQEIANYMMHGQEYYRPPPIDQIYQRQHPYPPRTRDYPQRSPDYPQRHHDNYQQRPHEYPPRAHEYPPRSQDYPPRSQDYPPRPHEYQPEYHPPYNPNVRGYPSPQLQDPYGQRYPPRIREHHSAPSHTTKHRPTAPPMHMNSSYESNYSQMQPPLCLKEIEVKSTGTQSERKMSIFRKLSKRMQPPVRPTTASAGGDDFQRTFSTQTPKAPQLLTKPAVNNMTKPLFNWKSLQAKAMQGLQTQDAMAYSLQTQKELATGDLKLRNAMLKKLFYKRNPFSPRNLIVRTLLGKDKSSYGEPPHQYRPRMFI